MDAQLNNIVFLGNGGGLVYPKPDNLYTTGFQGPCNYNFFSPSILPYTQAELSFWKASQDLTKNLSGGIFTTTVTSIIRPYQSSTTSDRKLLLGCRLLDCGNGGFNSSNAIHSNRSSATHIGDQPPKPPTSYRFTHSESRNHSNRSSATHVGDLSCRLARSENGYHSNRSSATQIDEKPPTSSRLTYRIIIDETK